MAKLQRWRRRGSGEGDGPVRVDESTEDTPAGNILDGSDADRPQTPDAPDGPGTDESPTELDLEPDEAVAPAPTTDEPSTTAPEEEAAPRPARTAPGRGGGFEARESMPLLLLQSSHPKQAVVTALAVGLVALLSGRPPEETGVVVATVLLGQMVLGWHNDLVDRQRDRAHATAGKPIADGRLSTANAWTTLIIVALVVVPLAITTGITAGLFYLGGYLAVGMLGNVLFRTGPLSFWSWAVSFGMLPAYLSYGGWGGQAEGAPPETAIVVLAALLGVGVHVLRSLWGLVADHEDGWTYLPLRLALRIGASRLLVLTSLYLGAVVVGLIYAGARVGLSQ